MFCKGKGEVDMFSFDEKLAKKYGESNTGRFKKIEELLSSMEKQIIPALEKPTDPTNPNHDPVYFRSMVIYYSCFLRAQEITNSFILAFNAQQHLSYILLTRSAQEITAWIYVVRNQLQDTLEHADWQTINNLFDKFLIGSKIFEWIDPEGKHHKTKPFRSGEVVSEMRKIIPSWGKDYNFFNEIIHFNHGGQAYYQKRMIGDIIGFDIPKELRSDIAEHLLSSITLMLEVILKVKEFFSTASFPQRLKK
jgi:hypothetical protein